MCFLIRVSVLVCATYTKYGHNLSLVSLPPLPQHSRLLFVWRHVIVCLTENATKMKTSGYLPLSRDCSVKERVRKVYMTRKSFRSLWLVCTSSSRSVKGPVWNEQNGSSGKVETNLADQVLLRNWTHLEWPLCIDVVFVLHPLLS